MLSVSPPKVTTIPQYRAVGLDQVRIGLDWIDFYLKGTMCN